MSSISRDNIYKLKILNMLMNKRGQGLSLNAIILIVLGVIVLFVLIAGFFLGTEGFRGLFSSNNVDKIATQCQTACQTNSKFDYCSADRDLIADEIKINDISCNLLNIDGRFGVASCPTITCDNECAQIKIKDKDGVDVSASEKDVCGSGEKDILGAKVVTSGNKCCIAIPAA
jgi:hypothetical protein